MWKPITKKKTVTLILLPKVKTLRYKTKNTVIHTTHSVLPDISKYTTSTIYNATSNSSQETWYWKQSDLSFTFLHAAPVHHGGIFTVHTAEEECSSAQQCLSHCKLTFDRNYKQVHCRKSTSQKGAISFTSVHRHSDKATHPNAAHWWICHKVRHSSYTDTQENAGHCEWKSTWIQSRYKRPQQRWNQDSNISRTRIIYAWKWQEIAQFYRQRLQEITTLFGGQDY